MSLKQQIDTNIKAAMLAKNKDELTALRAIKSMILLAETEKSGTGELSSDVESKLLMKAAKQRKESAEIFQKEGREDLAKTELLELEVISRYLPKQLSETEIMAEVKKIIEQVAAKGPQDMGKVMAVLKSKLAGRVDMSAVSAQVKARLSSNVSA